jgi:hypothetical protein
MNFAPILVDLKTPFGKMERPPDASIASNHRDSLSAHQNFKWKLNLRMTKAPIKQHEPNRGRVHIAQAKPAKQTKINTDIKRKLNHRHE